MSNFTTLYNTAGLPTGTIARGRINDPAWLPMNGGLYLKADYPELDTSQYLTFGNNTVQTASGTVTMPSSSLNSFGHNVDYTRLVFCDASGTLCRSTDGGLSWSNFTIPGMTGLAGINFLNGQFVAWNAAFFSTSADLLTWSAAAEFGFSNGMSSVRILDYFNGLYIAAGTPITSGSFGFHTSATLTSGSFIQRGTGITAFETMVPLANNNLRRGHVGANGAWRVGSNLSDPRFYVTYDGINYTTSGQAPTSPVPANRANITSSGFFTTKSGDIISYSQAGTEVMTDSTLRFDVPFPNSALINFNNLFVAHCAASGPASRVFVSESKYFLPSLYPEVLPGSAPSHYCAFTPTRLIIVPSGSATSIYYLNIDPARFRLERPFMDGHFVDDAYIKAA